MPDNRIKSHPILTEKSAPTVPFYWEGEKFFAKPGEMISSALFAKGIKVFGHHPKDGSPQGIYCANGQCSQCMVLADELPVKACMTAVKEGMHVKPANGLFPLPEVVSSGSIKNPEITYEEPDVLILGGGPAGLSAAIELGKLAVSVILVDDKDRLGGKLVLQTHRFFGSSEAVFAGTRGIDIAKKLENETRSQTTVEVWLRSTALAVFEDKSVGVLRDNKKYQLIKPKILLVSTGAREKSLPFVGNTLPGVYGAGAFQTLVNRDLVKPCQNLFIVGGGNVGLIAGYHAIQAGIHVAGLVEAAPQCGGYKVHLDKLKRSGVPIFTSTTVVKAVGTDSVEKVIITSVDGHFQPIPGTEREVPCDTVLIAVGLDPVNEFLNKAKDVGMQVYSAGDAKEIAEASAAIFSGKIVGNQIATALGKRNEPIPLEWAEFETILKSKPGKLRSTMTYETLQGVFPVMHCDQEIPCDPCSTVCPKHLITISKTDIRNTPIFPYDQETDCIACARCVSVCPGLAVSLVDFRKSKDYAVVTLPYEQDADQVRPGTLVKVTDVDGGVLDELTVLSTRKMPNYSGTTLISVKAPKAMATKISGVKIISSDRPEAFDQSVDFKKLADEAIICRCERVTAGEIRALIRSGVRDVNQIKATLRASMGACGGKTCLTMIKRLFVSEGIALVDVAETTVRPVFVEVPIGVLAGIEEIKIDHAGGK
ncbi:MAG TPA: FAD-dependent oxidoreductase [Anaerolineaceae bacterium]|nr:FAD-dependent oxidoreductase [Anaerolineaceae bacterium]